MSDPMTDERFDSVMRTFLAARAVDTASIRSPERIVRAIASPAPMRRSARRGSARRIALLAAVVTVGLIAVSAAFVGGRRPAVVPVPPSTSAGPSARPTRTPTARPTDATSMTSETSLGTIAWTRVDAQKRVYAASVDGERILGWGSEDAWYAMAADLTWEPIPTPVHDPSSFVVAGDDTWVVSSPGGHGGTMMGPVSYRQVFARAWTDDGGAAAILRRDGSTWVAVPIPSTTPSPVAGLEILGPDLGVGAALSPSSWVVASTHLVRVPWDDLYPPAPRPTTEGIGGGMRPLWNEGAEELDIYDPGAFEPYNRSKARAALIVELVDGDPATIRFRDADTRKIVHRVEATLPGWSPEALMTAIRGWGLDDVSFLVYLDGTITAVRSPWPGGEEWGGAIVTSKGRYYTLSFPLGKGYSATAIHLWESTDGLEWRAVEIPKLYNGTLERADLSGGPEGLVMTVQEMERRESAWASTDGRTWTEADVAESQIGFLSATDFGWMMQGTYRSVAISADGRSWDTVELPRLPGEPSISYLGGRFIFGPEEQPPGVYRTWIGTLSP